MKLELKNKKIVVLGDLIADVYITGKISRMSREAPIPVVVEQERKTVLGGAGNVIANIEAMGGEAIPISILGMDVSGEKLRELLFEPRTVYNNWNWTTTTKTRIVTRNNNAASQQIFRMDILNKIKQDEQMENALIEYLDHSIPKADALIVSDYKEGVITNKIINEVNKIALSGFPVFVDSPRFNQFYRAHTLKPNEQELLNRYSVTEPNVFAAGEYFRKEYLAQNVLVTRGCAGMTLFTKGNEPFSIPAYGTTEVADVTGAGDTVIAAYTLSILSGMNPEQAAFVANVAAGLKVRKFGTAVVTIAELTRELRGLE